MKPNMKCNGYEDDWCDIRETCDGCCDIDIHESDTSTSHDLPDELFEI